MVFFMVVASAGVPCGTNAPSITVMNTNDSGAGSLRCALEHITTNGTIRFDAALNGQTIALQSQLLIERSMTVDASDLPDGIIIDGGSNGDLVHDAGETRCLVF